MKNHALQRKHDHDERRRRAHDTARPNASGVNVVTVNRRMPNANPNDGRLKG